MTGSSTSRRPFKESLKQTDTHGNADRRRGMGNPGLGRNLEESKNNPELSCNPSGQLEGAAPVESPVAVKGMSEMFYLIVFPSNFLLNKVFHNHNS